MTKVEDFINFFWGRHYPPYLIELTSIRVGSEKNFKRALHVCWCDPEDESIILHGISSLNPLANHSVLTEDHLELALSAVRRGATTGVLCCQTAIDEGGVGMGCADDLDLILQYALFEEVCYG